jgi:hypothetical protein
MRRVTRHRWKPVLGLAAALGASGCSGSVGCPQDAVICYGISVFAPDGSRVCDAVVMSRRVGSNVKKPAIAGGFEADCAYEGLDGPGTYVITAHKAGYVDAQVTVHVSSPGGSCPQVCEVADLHLARADGGAADGSTPASDAAPGGG